MASRPVRWQGSGDAGLNCGRRNATDTTHQHVRDRHVTYSVKEIFKTLQGEGGQAGRAAVFCRFAGYNLWTGRQEDRGAAVCQFCDTDSVGTDGSGGGRFSTPDDLADAIAAAWNGAPDFRY